ncbi:TonB-dependent receptor [Tamlana agarivorans]|uniref:TonB-dependent receptor n=1 Tax=Pseudotamlana agarivorans TaxID=481183 RepID=A0ACC5UCI3_9FLAO|nr:TonB-dependent receptor [Tamlana agarivorans]MBU2952037.1 TonB-dependent receptor [Tamlana agarivorans]
MNLKTKLTLMLMMIFNISLFAQDGYQLSGTVTDESNTPIPGINVIIAKTTTGTATDFDGGFTLNVKPGDVLQFSYIGYVKQSVTISNQKSLNIVMVEDASQLEEVVVVGYGARKKSDVTGSVSSVKTEELTAFPVLDASQALQGRAAGVDVQSNNGGEPGAPISIKIRGNTSINASSSPLIVVDGFVGGNMPQAGDIESMQILKDASATAIYGSQGANGVVLVTTKKGKVGRLNIDFNTTYQVQSTSNSLDLLNANDFAKYQNNIRVNQGNSNAYPQGPYDTDWQDMIYRNGSVVNHQLAVSGGSEKVKYYASATYFGQDGVLVNSDYERLTFLSNLDAQVTDKLKVGVNLVGGRSQKSGVTTQSNGSVTVGGDDVVSLAMRFAPDKGVYEADGSFSTNDAIGDAVDNPYAVATERDDDTEIDNFRANLFASYDILEGLNFKTTFGISGENTFRGMYMPRTLKITAGTENGRAIMQNTKSESVLSESYLTYNREIGKGVLTLLGGYSYQQNTNKSAYNEGIGTISDSFSYYGLYTATSLIQPTSGQVYTNERTIQSVFGRVNFDFNDKYLLTATVRRDGASNFAENHKYATFPSAALGWKISNEKFLEDSNAISNLKLRASYGETGNPSIAPYQSLASSEVIYASSAGSTVAAITPYQMANPDLKWETSIQTNLGLDFGFLNNRITLSLDYYNIDTEDLIMVNRGQPDYLGFYNNESLVNVGAMNNTGFEVFLTTNNITNDNFTWSTDFVFSKNINKVTSLINGDDWFGNGAPSYFSLEDTFVLREGEEVGQFWGYDYAGVAQSGGAPAGTAAIAASRENGVVVPGEPLFRDLDGDGEITDADRTMIGNPNPDFTWGFTNNFTYKNWDLNIFFQGSQGNEIFNMTAVQLNNGDSNTTYDYFNNAWTPSNTDTNEPRVGNASFREISSRFVEDGSYIRLKNLALGYNLPSKVIENIGIEKLRLSVSGQNLFTITDYSGLDPEVSYFGAQGGTNGNNQASNTTRGFDFGSYPTVRSFSFSLNLTF